MKHVTEKAWVRSMAPLIHKFGTMKVSDAVTIAKTVYQMYADETRSYHGVYHPMHILQYAKENNIDLNKEQTISIVFHDVVYKMGNSNNEEASALFAEAVLIPHAVSEDDLRSLCKIKNHIIDTKQHFSDNPKLKEKDSDLVLDLDICNMTLSFSEFKKWNDAIKFELGDIPIEKRIEFLKNFVSKEKIVLSSCFKDKEDKIRKNLYRLIGYLEAEQNLN